MSGRIAYRALPNIGLHGILLLLVVLASGCTSISAPRADRAWDARATGAGEFNRQTRKPSFSERRLPAIPGWRFQNSGARHTDYPGSREWANHLGKLVTGEFASNNPLPEGHVESEKNALKLFQQGSRAAGEGALSITWFGHASMLLQSNGVSVLTDPIFSKKTGPLGLGARRMAPVRPSASRIDDLDVILISHSDYDHLDLPTLRRLSRRFPDALVIVPKGTKILMATTGFRNVRELGYYESQKSDGLEVTAVEAIHGTRRLPTPINFSHWNGYRITINAHEVYFSGDTGAGDFGPRILAKTGASDIAIVPAGAWAPREFEKPFHVNPDEAMELARSTGAKTAIAMHWGTLPLSEDSNIRQKEAFLKAGKRARLRALTLKIGETRVFE